MWDEITTYLFYSDKDFNTIKTFTDFKQKKTEKSQNDDISTKYTSQKIKNL